MLNENKSAFMLAVKYTFFKLKYIFFILVTRGARENDDEVVQKESKRVRGKRKKTRQVKTRCDRLRPVVTKQCGIINDDARTSLKHQQIFNEDKSFLLWLDLHSFQNNLYISI